MTHAERNKHLFGSEDPALDALIYAYDNGFRWPERFGINSDTLKARHTQAGDADKEAVERLFPIRPLTEGRIVDCPRCHQQCGWCSDPRWMHGKLKLPGTKKHCTIDLEPEGENCPLCFGELIVVARTEYAPITRIEAGTDETPKGDGE